MDVSFYATLDESTLKSYLPDLPFMLPLASWWRRDLQLKHPPHLPSQLTHVAVDCGSYTLAQRQISPGYHFTAEQYVNWIAALGPAVRWAVLPDWPCEGAGAGEVRRRQVATTETAVDMLSEHLGVPWCWCPVLQGQTVDDYLRHAIDIADWAYGLHDVYTARGQGDDFRVCIGSLCRRNAVAEILDIVNNVCAVLPGLAVHLLGRLDTVICHLHRTRQPPRDVFHARSRRRSARKPWNDRTSMKVVIGDDLRCGESRPS